MRITCPNCGGAHPAWDCKRPATKSTAALSVRVGTRNEEKGREQVQALPVDTNSEPLLLAAAIPQRMGSSPRKDEGTEAPNPKRPRGRPRIHPDRKAYKAQWERDKRKRMKAKGDGDE